MFPINKVKAAKGFVVLLLSSGILLYFYTNNPSTSQSLFLRCPSNLIFGFNCPGCGTQRALHHLLHLEVIEALRYNALFVLALPFIIYGVIIKIYNLIFDAKKTIRIPTKKFVWIGLLILVLLFGILRNIPIYPFNLLIP